MAAEKIFNPEKPVEITMSWADWNTVLHWMKFAIDCNYAQKYEWMAAPRDNRLAAAKAAEHEAESLAKIIEAELYPAPPKETE